MNLGIIADTLGIISFPLGLIAFLQALSVKRMLRERAIDKWVQSQFAELKKLKKSNAITQTARRDINQLLRALNDFYVGRWPWSDKEIKKLMQKIRESLQNQTLVEKLPEELETLHSALFTTNRV